MRSLVEVARGLFYVAATFVAGHARAVRWYR